MTRSPKDSKGADWQTEIERTQAQLDELAELWAAGEVTRGEWLKARPPIEKRPSIPVLVSRSPPSVRHETRASATAAPEASRTTPSRPAGGAAEVSQVSRTGRSSSVRPRSYRDG